MNVGLVQAAAALNANQRWQEAIADNLSASSVPGYRKQDVSFSSIQGGLLGTQSTNGSTSSVLLPKVASSINFQQGQTIFTGVETNVALEGSGFFEVRLANGGTAYTRDGEFKLNSQGELVTKNGFLVMGEGGSLQFDMRNGAPISISANGDVKQGEDVKGKIKVVDFNDPQLLTSLGQNCFQANHAQLQIVQPANTKLSQKYIESANTSSVKEMSNLITAMRTFEANQRVIQLSDERASRAITELGNPN